MDAKDKDGRGLGRGFGGKPHEAWIIRFFSRKFAKTFWQRHFVLYLVVTIISFPRRIFFLKKDFQAGLFLSKIFTTSLHAHHDLKIVPSVPLEGPLQYNIAVTLHDHNLLGLILPTKVSPLHILDIIRTVG